MEIKELRAKKAQEHVKHMEVAFQQHIQDSVKSTRVYTDDTFEKMPKSEFGRPSRNPNISITADDCVKTIFKENKKDLTNRMAVLNFASYTNIGGGFLNGSMAQEEALCHDSTLYNVLRCFSPFYTRNNSNKNNSLYLNRALYSPRIVFTRKVETDCGLKFLNEETIFCDVITCAAPNYKAAKEHGISKEENTTALRSRIQFVLKCADTQYVNTLILGAYGAGVFGQDPYEVASIFKEELESGKYGFSNVVFSILPLPNDKNLVAFKEVFGLK